MSSEPLPEAPPGEYPAWLPDSCENAYVSYLQQFTHSVNLIRWLLDAGHDVHVTAADLDADGLTGVAVLKVAGVRTVLESAEQQSCRFDEHIQIYFERGWIRTLVPPPLARQAAVQIEVYYAGRPSESVELVTPTRPTWSYRAELRHFADCLRSGEEFRSSASDSTADVRAIEQIYRRYLQGAPAPETAVTAGRLSSPP